MFGAQAASLMQQLTAAGLDPKIAEIFGNTFGQCMASLAHRGFVELKGGGSIGKNLLGNNHQTILNPSLGAMLYNGYDATNFFSMFDTSNSTTPYLYIEGTLTGDLAADGTRTETVGGRSVTINGKGIRATKEIASGATFGAIWNGTDYTVIWVKTCDQTA